MFMDIFNKQKSSRNTCIWEYGFKANGYDDIPLIFYTDGHDTTFKEYLNNRQLETRFNLEMSVTSYLWTTAKTLEVA